MTTAGIHIIDTLQPPVSVDAVVEEQDTCLLLGTDSVIEESKENYVTLIKKMEQQKPLQPGQVLVRNTFPLKFTAIIYDIENNPVCREEWIQTCLQNLFMECKKRKIISLLMPLPGVKYGKVSKDTAMNILQNALHTGQSDYPEKVFIINGQ